MPDPIGIPTHGITPNHLRRTTIRTPDAPDPPVSGYLASTFRVTAYNLVTVQRIINYWNHGIRRVYHEDIACFYRRCGVELSAFCWIMAL